jgi:hypothetical protein
VHLPEQVDAVGGAVIDAEPGPDPVVQGLLEAHGLRAQCPLCRARAGVYGNAGIPQQQPAFLGEPGSVVDSAAFVEEAVLLEILQHLRAIGCARAVYGDP